VNSGELIAKLIKREYNQELYGEDKCFEFNETGQLSLIPRKYDYSRDTLIYARDNGVLELWMWTVKESKFIRISQ